VDHEQLFRELMDEARKLDRWDWAVSALLAIA